MYSRGFGLGFGIAEQEASAMLKSEAGEEMDPTLPILRYECAA
jgi:hypothetical protein